MTERDPLLRRMERNGIVACGAMAVVAWAVARGRLAAPLGVVAGGVLVQADTTSRVASTWRRPAAKVAA